jgi:hypothetical protein
MAVFHMYFNGFNNARHVFQPRLSEDGNEYVPHPRSKYGPIDDYKMFRGVLENTCHQFVFILTKAQWPIWENKRELYGYKDYILYEMPYFVSNRRYEHHGDGRKLRLVVLKGKGTNV